ncbi:MAG: peptide chain release factor N(5)-glutamine methyltransferase [Candidatus Kapabacteria bacterium]|nr:peptide chain release factor N(5)-glutamine methyltransferase [Candidatus Kapabacteria bacterium]
MKTFDKTWTVIDIIRWGTEYFQNKQIDSPRLTIELLLCEVLNCERISLYTNFEKPLKDEELQKLKEFIKRRANREPLQFILGKTKFFNTELKINNSAIVPRPETELMVSIADEIIQQNIDKIKDVLDIGTGSGCIAISLAKKYPNINFTAIDINPNSLQLAKENAIYNDVENSMNFLNLDILTNVPDEKYDLVISNPPYISKQEYEQLEPEILNYEPKEALTDNSDGLTFYRRFSDIFGVIMTPNAFFLLEIAYNQFEDVSKIFKEKGFEINYVQDWSGIKRIIIGQKQNRY